MFRRSSSIRLRTGTLDRTVERASFLLLLVLGALQGISHFSFLDPDGLSYLDISDAWLRHDWTHCINAYWSPLFPALIASLRTVLPQTSYFEFGIVHLAGYVSFVTSLICFRLLVHELESRQESWTPSPLPRWIFRGLAYVLFSWASLSLIRVYWPTPDMILSAIVYLSAWLCLKLERAVQPKRTAAVLGIVLGLGYWTKAAFLTSGLLFLLSFVAFKKDASRLRLAVVALSTFCLMAAPLIAVLSAKTGHPTIGETGKLNYSWNVNENTMFLHWQGEVPDSGTPVHATRKVLSDPPMYEYGSPVAGTYPPWYDPSYWYAGVRTYFNLNQQFAAVVRNVRRFGGTLWRYPGGVAVLLCLYVTIFLCGRYDSDRLRSLQFLFWPALATIGLYMLVAVRPRYIAPFLVIVLVLFLVGATPGGDASRRRATWCATIALPVSAAWVAAGPLVDTFQLVQQLKAGQEVNHSWQIAQAVQKAGVPPGSPVATIGAEFFPFWARVARDRVVAEVYDPERFQIWTTENYPRRILVSTAQWPRVLRAFRSAGARVIVTSQTSVAADLLADGWTKVPGTDAALYVLR